MLIVLFLASQNLYYVKILQQADDTGAYTNELFFIPYVTHDII